jgi:hypothetical protein
MAGFPYHTPVEIVLKDKSHSDQQQVIRGMSPKLAEVLCDTGLLRYSRYCLQPELGDHDERRQGIAKKLHELVGSCVSELILNKIYRSNAQPDNKGEEELSFLTEPYLDDSEIFVGPGIPSPATSQIAPTPPITSENVIRTPHGEIVLSNFLDSREMVYMFQNGSNDDPLDVSIFLSLFPLNATLIQEHYADSPNSNRTRRSEELCDLAWSVTRNVLSTQNVFLHRDTLFEMLSYERAASGYPLENQTSLLLCYAQGLYVRFASALT